MVLGKHLPIIFKAEVIDKMPKDNDSCKYKYTADDYYIQIIITKYLPQWLFWMHGMH